MNFVYIFLLYICLSSYLATSLTTSEQILSSLEKEIQKIAQTVPSNTASLITNIQSQANSASDSFDVSQMIEILQNKHKLAPDFINSFKNILFSDSVTFQSFSASINHQTGLVTEFIGCGRKVGNTAEIAYIQIGSSGTTVVQYNQYKTRSCHRVIFWKKCHDEWHNVPRGFSTQEIETIFTALRAYAYQKGLQIITAPPKILKNFDKLKESIIFENKIRKSLNAETSLSLFEETTTSLIEELISNIMAKIPEMKADILRNSSTIVDKIVNWGFTDFKETANMKQINGVQDQYFLMFLDNLKSTINLPSKYVQNFESTMEVILYSTSNIWIVFDVAFSVDSGAQCKYVCVMARHDDIGKKTDWLIADVAATFDLAPDVLIIQQKQSVLGGIFSSSQDKIVLKPASITKNQLNTIFEFFEVISFERFAELLDINKVQNPQVSFVITEIVSALTMAKSAIELVTSAWTSIVNAFKTSKSQELKQILEGKGFSYFSESGEMQKVTGLKLEYYNTFTNQLMNRLEVPDGKRPAFIGILQLLTLFVFIFNQKSLIFILISRIF